MKKQNLTKAYMLPVATMLVLCLFNAYPVWSQDSLPPPPAKKWHYIVEPYLMFPNMNGTVGIGNLPDAEVDENPDDIFKNVQFAAMLYAEAYSDRWAISSDFTYMDLGSDVTGGGVLINFGHAKIKQLAWELAGLRKFLPWLEGGIGLQLNSIKSELSLNVNTMTGPADRASSITETWVDPSVIARVKFPIGKKFTLTGRGNIGGFGIGSDFYWQLQTYLVFRLSKLMSLSAGYRVIDMDYEKGSGSDRFKYDMATFGPVFRFGFNF